MLERRVLTGTVLHLVAKVVTALGSATAALLVGRFLGDSEYGRFSVHVALLVAGAACVDFGSGAIALREVSRAPERESALLAATFRLRLRLAAGCALLFAAVALWREAEARSALLPALAGLSFFAAAPATSGLWLQARVRLLWLAAAPVFGIGAFLVASAALRAAGVRDGGAFVVAFAGGQALQALPPWLAARRDVVLAAPAERALIALLLREMAPIGLSAAFSALYFRADTLFLSTLCDEPTAGRYARAFQLLAFAIALPSNLCAALFPAFARAAADRARLVALVQRIAVVLLACALPLMAVAPWWGGQVLEGLWPKRQLGADGELVRCVALLAATAGAIFLSYPQMNALTALGRQRQLAVVAAAALVAKGVVGFLLIGRFGLVGAAWTTVVIEWSVSITVALLLTRAAGGNAWSRALFRPLLVALPIGGLAYCGRDLAPPLALAACVLLFGVALFACGALPLRLGSGLVK